MLGVDRAKTTGPVDTGRSGTAAVRQLAGDHVHAPHGQAGRTVEYVRSTLLFGGVRPERAAVRAPVLVAHQSAAAAAFVFRVQHRPVTVGRGHRHGHYCDGRQKERLRRPPRRHV